MGNNLKALLALLLLVLIPGHLGGGQGWAVLVMHLKTNSNTWQHRQRSNLHPVFVHALRRTVVKEAAMRAAQERILILHLPIQ